MMVWNKTADELLLKLWTEGLSLTKVAEGLCEAGYDVKTRSTIAGRMHRLKQMGYEIEGRRVIEKSVEEKSAVEVKMEKTQKEIEEAAQARLAVFTRRGWRRFADQSPVDYLENNYGCKALMEERGVWDLPKCCGKIRACDPEGRRSSYCQEHYKLFHTGGGDRRYGEESKRYGGGVE
jgi:hypothetical protein